MANPQKENGHTGISNELLEAIIGARLNGTEYATLLHVVRKTYGFLKKEDWISYTQFEKATGRTRPNIWKSIESLVTKKILVTKKKLGSTLYRLNKDYTQWVVTNPKLVTKKKSASYEKEMEVVTNSKPTKETITKETITKETLLRANTQERASDFDIFWKKYPNKTGKKYCRKIWKKLKPEERRLAVEKIDLHIASVKWQEYLREPNKKRFIPDPSTWLNQGRWEDEVEVLRGSAVQAVDTQKKIDNAFEGFV